MSGDVNKTRPNGLRRIAIILLVCSIVQFSTIWYYPESVFSGINTAIQEKSFGVPFQYTLWLVLALTFVYDASNSKLDFYLSVCKPYVCFLFFGVLSSLFGVMPFDSFRLIFLFIVMLLAATLPVAVLSSSDVHRISYHSFVFIIVASVVVAILVPHVGVQSYGGVPAWRGLFTNKNTFGWFSAICFIISVIFFDRAHKVKSLFFVLFPVLALLLSQSKGSLVSAFAALIFIPLLVFLQKRVSLWVAFFAFLIIFIIVSLLGYFFFTDVLLLLGRDPTLTGRTVIWNMYFNSMLARPFLGGGAGSYTSLSELTFPIAYRLQDMGAILTPHNIYLAAFGESGLIGFLSFVGILFYFSFFQYFNYANIYSLACSAISILLLIGGFTDTHEVFSPGFTMFTIVMFRALALKNSRDLAVMY